MSRGERARTSEPARQTASTRAQPTGGFLERIAAGEVLVADGAMGSLLMARGLEPGHCPEALNLTRPELPREIASLYLAAGADIIQTNSFGGSPLKLEPYGLADRTAEINRAAVVAAREAVGDRAFVSGSVGPCGKILKPYGDVDPEPVRDSFKRQIAALAGAGVDLLAIETMTDLAEATLAIEAARSAAPGMPIIATMTFDPTPRGFFTVMGVDIVHAAAGLTAAGADLVGSNCGNGSASMVAIAREFRRHTDRPVVIQSNAGLPRIDADQVVYDESPDHAADAARELIEAGVAVIGGCCGTTPEHIAAVRKIVDELKRHG